MAGEKYSTHIPFLVLISPTYECNLECKGCYSALYGNRFHYTEEEIFDLIQQFYDLGVRFFTFTGGEPFVYQPLMKIFSHFDDCYFMVFTNGTMLTESRVKKLAELGNVAVTISVEGFKDMTDWRRGKGPGTKLLPLTNGLSASGSCAAPLLWRPPKTTSRSVEMSSGTLSSTRSGLNMPGFSSICLWVVMLRWTWFLTPGSAMSVFISSKRYANRAAWGSWLTSGITVFWLTAACQVGANYLHINAKGGAEPCVFQPYATDNVREKRIIDILKSPFLRAISNKFPSITT
jgi:MoaA/NifB/PqqE/SkfB family radical SAM enzyme